MRKPLLALCLLLAVSMFPPLRSLLRAQEKPPSAALPVGAEAPDFTLKYFDGAEMKDVSLKDFKGKKNVVLAFYIFAFTPG
jgi:peroxiredoxin (alkyl hydroperoxide reductase subunit C)